MRPVDGWGLLAAHGGGMAGSNYYVAVKWVVCTGVVVYRVHVLLIQEPSQSCLKILCTYARPIFQRERLLKHRR
jgi:hypothetical protein